MIEGQEDVTWDDWVAIAEACERSGVGTLFRSDHYYSVDDKGERGSLDAWATLAGLAAITEKLRLGTMVSPATFRHPSVFAKSAVTVDQISGGRVEPGLGAGWWDREHEAYGFDLPELGPRMDAFEEQLEIVTRQWEDGSFSFDGEHYKIVEGPKEMAELRGKLDAACEMQDRDPATLPLSVMTGWIVGETREDVVDRASRLSQWKGEGDDGEKFLAAQRDAVITGTVEEAVEQLRALHDAGCHRIMAQHLLHRDIEGIELIGREVAPRVEAF